MKRAPSGSIVYSPSDLIRFLSSPFGSWMDRHHLENPGTLEPDRPSEEERLIQRSGDAHEKSVLAELTSARVDLASIHTRNFAVAHAETIAALEARRQVVYQAALRKGPFEGFSDFIELQPDGQYSVWDTKLARSPKPYYLVQLCAYSEMLEELTGYRPERCGVILGARNRVEFRIEDFFHYYSRLKRRFLELQDGYSGDPSERPEPMPRADHGRWGSHAERFFEETDHLVRVAGITRGQIKKLNDAGIVTMTQLAASADAKVRALAPDSRQKLAAQAALQCQTLERRKSDPECRPSFQVLPARLPDGRANGLTLLPPQDAADVFFDMEGYPLVPGGLEYLFGLVTRDGHEPGPSFRAWWAHDRAEEKAAFEGFVDHVHGRWLTNPGMHVFHYAPYEVTAVRRLSTRHDTRQEEVDDLLRSGVFVDLYHVVRRGLMLGEDSYSIKLLERLYRGKRKTTVATAADSIVQYASWLASGESRSPSGSPILAAIEEYNEDDCRSTVELYDWLMDLAKTVDPIADAWEAPGVMEAESDGEDGAVQPEPDPTAERAAELRARAEPLAITVADVLNYHRREDKPKWWRVFDRASGPSEDLRDDAACIEAVSACAAAEGVKRSLVRRFEFDPAQECKLAPKDQVFFTDHIGATFTIEEIDTERGRLALKIGATALAGRQMEFPSGGGLIQSDIVDTRAMRESLLRLADRALDSLETLPASVSAMLGKQRPAGLPARPEEGPVDAAARIVAEMDGDFLVIQGPPGTGKTYTASRVIAGLLADGKSVGVASNSHKAISNLMAACGEAADERGYQIRGVKVGGNPEEEVLRRYSGLEHCADSKKATLQYAGGLIGGTAWLFSRPEWREGQLDYLFIDEAGQVPLANALAMATCAKNVVLLGDQMQLEQPVQGTHPGDASLSVLQYALKDEELSVEDAPVFHPVVPADIGLFLATSRRMHPAVCRFISESIYDGRLSAHGDCAQQTIETSGTDFQDTPHGIAFVPVIHEGNVQKSEEEVERVAAVYRQLLGRSYTDKTGAPRDLALKDFLFIAPYNAQVRALKAALPEGARVGSVDKFQGQEAPVCVLSMCSSFGEYGSRGLGFILDKNRLNVAVSRAMCLAVVVGDPRIADSLPGSVEEMRLLNLYCKLSDEGSAGA